MAFALVLGLLKSFLSSYLVTANHYGAKMLLRNVSGFRVCQSCR